MLSGKSRYAVNPLAGVASEGRDRAVAATEEGQATRGADLFGPA